MIIWLHGLLRYHNIGWIIFQEKAKIKTQPMYTCIIIIYPDKLWQFLGGS